MFELTERDLKRFWSKVGKRHPSQCWNWTATAKSHSGYGLFKLSTGMEVARNVVASRIACFLAHGPAPEGKPHALHSCDNPACCNPNHLRWGSVKDNVRDALERGRHSPPPVGNKNPNPRRGEEVKTSTLTNEIVRQIWAMHMDGKSVTEISEAVNRSKDAVYDVCRGRSWRHLSDAPTIEELRRGGVPRGYNQYDAYDGDPRDISHKTKLSRDEIAEIRKHRKSGLSSRQIAIMFNVSGPTIRRLWHD